MTHHRACRTATDRSGSQTSIRTGASAVGLVAGARTCEADFVLVLFLDLDHLGHELFDDALLDDLRKTATRDTWCPSPRQNQSDHDTPRRMVRETCVVCGVWFMAVVLMVYGRSFNVMPSQCRVQASRPSRASIAFHCVLAYALAPTHTHLARDGDFAGLLDPLGLHDDLGHLSSSHKPTRTCTSAQSRVYIYTYTYTYKGLRAQGQ